MISRESFEKEQLSNGTVRENILNFLKENRDNAYTCKEIYTKLKINVTSASINLGKLTKEGLVEHKGKARNSHWIFKEGRVDG